MNKVVKIGIHTNWRQLSNLYHLKWLRIDNENWLSVEHYLQAQKYVDYVKYYNIIKACDSSIKAFAIGEQDPNLWKADTKVNNAEYSHLTVREVIIEMIELNIKIRNDWKEIRSSLLTNAILEKINQFDEIYMLLMSTRNLGLYYDDLILSRHYLTVHHDTSRLYIKFRDNQ